MKKIISLVLTFVMILSLVPTTMAAWHMCGQVCPICGLCGNPDCPDGEFCGHYPPVDYTSGTQITLVGSQEQASYSVTVPAVMSPGDTGNVTVSGAWASNQTIHVTCPNKVTVSYGEQTMDVGINFTGIHQAGNDITASSASKEISVADASVLFGTWVGQLSYVVEMTENDGGAVVIEGDGQTYHKMAPSTLSFRSTAPLGEFQEVKINGETIDPSNYSLTEGSTIVTLDIDYLDTLDINNYDISIVSDSGSPRAGFSVITSEKSSHGPYYNQPYYAKGSIGTPDNYMDIEHCIVLHEDGTVSMLNLHENTSDSATIEWNEDVCVISFDGAKFTGTFSDDGKTFNCYEAFIAGGGWAPDFVGDGIDFALNNSIAASDDEYYYMLDEDNTFHASPIDATKSTYRPIKSNILNIPVSAISKSSFNNNAYITTMPTMPNSINQIGAFAFNNCDKLDNVIIPSGITYIHASAFSNCDSLTNIKIGKDVERIHDYAFADCSNLTSISFDGTMAEWSQITLDERWANNIPATTVTCSDGNVTIS